MKSRLIAVSVVLVLLIAGCVDQGDEQETGPAEVTFQPVTTEWVADGVISEGEYAQSQVLSGGKFEVHWRNDAEVLHMAIKGETEGWVAVGFDPTEWMKDADIVMGWVEEGEANVLDLYSTERYGPHPEDTELGGSDDILEFGGREDEGSTVIEFGRKMNTGDQWDKVFTPGQTVEMIWATSESYSHEDRHDQDGERKLTFQ